MGRRRTTGCTARHFSGETCRICNAVRAKRSRRRRKVVEKPVTADPQRLELDRQAAAHRDHITKAYTKVNQAIRCGTVAPPTACERCGVPAVARSAKPRDPDPTKRVPRPRPRIALHAWLPDPAVPKAIAWLCTLCRAHVRATREPLVLRWVWPGMPPMPRGRPNAADLPQYAADAALEESVQSIVQRGLPRLAEAIFFLNFARVAGERADALYVQGLRAVLRGVRWTPTGERELDTLLERWVLHERARRESDAGGGDVVMPVPARERRPRRDRLPPVVAEPESIEPVREASFDENEALTRLDQAEAKFFETMDRIFAAVNGSGRCDHKGTVGE